MKLTRPRPLPVQDGLYCVTCGYYDECVREGRSLLENLQLAARAVRADVRKTPRVID
jgi:hypothetical protein